MFVYNLTDNITTYIFDENLESVLKSLRKNSVLATRWFVNN